MAENWAVKASIHGDKTSLNSQLWKVVGEESGIQYGPFPVPKGGLPIKVFSREKKITS